MNENSASEECRARRVAMVVALDYAIKIMAGQCRITNIPAGARALHVWADPYSESIVIILQHDSYDPVTPGYEYPRVYAEIERIKSDDAE